MIKETIPELQKLSTADKFALAVELWDELSSNPDEMPVTEEQLNELDRRFEEYRQDPDLMNSRILIHGKRLRNGLISSASIRKTFVRESRRSIPESRPVFSLVSYF